jgi:ATP-dependent exoDNAse (exonuclease V) alpha subunit
MWTTRESWSCRRRVVAKAEWTQGEANPRFVVTSLQRDKDAQLTREIEFALPRELDQSQGIELARAFAEREFVARGMIADLNVHWDVGAPSRMRTSC